MEDQTTPLNLIAEAIHIAICEESPKHCADWRGKCVKAAERLLSVLDGWTIALHSDGSGQPGLYHECDPENAIDWIEADTLTMVTTTMQRHVCDANESGAVAL